MHGPNPEDRRLARAVMRRIFPGAGSKTDVELDADPFAEWVECLFRKVRDESTSSMRARLHDAEAALRRRDADLAVLAGGFSTLEQPERMLRARLEHYEAENREMAATIAELRRRLP